MKFEEVIPALRAGKKIRRTKWKEDICISIAIKGDCDHYVRYNFGSVFNFNKSDFESDDWEIVKEIKKVKLRDLTAEQYKKWRDENCRALAQIEWCVGCPFEAVRCQPDDNPRYLNKDIFNDKFLDQEVEIEED